MKPTGVKQKTRNSAARLQPDGGNCFAPSSASPAHQEDVTMEFGICFDTHIDKWDLIRYVEELGYDRAWVPDSQMIWSDCYATMALAAQATTRIKIGTGVAIPGTRIAPVTAHSIATINEIAPARVFLGSATRHTATRSMCQHPRPIC